MWFESWTAVDTETTGLGSTARVVEVACVTFESGQIAREWTQLLYPDGVNWDDPNVKKALEVNRLTRDELEGKPRFGDVVGDLLLEMSHPVIVAHNAEFDMRMLNQELQRLGRQPLSPQLLICTKNLASQLSGGTPGNRLADVACRYNVLQEGAHRAAADAITCGRVLHRMYELGKLPQADEEMGVFCRRADAAWKGKHRW